MLGTTSEPLTEEASMKDIEHSKTVWEKYETRLGSSQWAGGTDASVAFCWPDKNGKYSRGSTAEIPAQVLAMLTVYAVEHQYLTWPMLLDAAREVSDA
jgi:hypothetical protein